MSTFIEVAPAYGREYKNQKEITADWDANKDFMVTEGGRYGSYVTKEEAEKLDLKVIVRYAKQRKVFAVN